MPTVFLSTFGSFGDIYPYIALSGALKGLGAEPVAFVNPAFVDHFAEQGIDAIPVGERLDVATLLKEEPKYLHPHNGTRFAIQDLYAPFSAQTFREAMKLAENKPPALCVSHHMALGTAWVAERLGVPSAVIHLAPASFLSIADPPAIGPNHTALWVRRTILRLALPLFSRMSDRLYFQEAKAVGVTRESVDIMRTSLRPDLLLGLWSPLFRGPASDDSDAAHIAGFPTSAPKAPLTQGEGGVSDDLEAFLCAGAPPLAFGLGSSSVYCPGDFFNVAVAACETLGMRGLLFGKQAAPSRLPEGVLSVAFEPFDQVLPRCAAFVHHGSIGSTAAGLRAGVPTVVMPFAHDQFDNAERVEALGVSTTLSRKRLSREAVVEVLRQTLAGGRKQRAAELAKEIGREGDGAQRAAELVMQVGAGR